MLATSNDGLSRIAVTGGSGFIGTNLVNYLSTRGKCIINLDKRPPRDPSARALWREIDILDARPLSQNLVDFRPDAVVHLAARTDLHGSSVDDYIENIDGVKTVIDAAQAGGVQRIIFASSRMVCRIGYQPASMADYCPPNAYGESKARGEQVVRESGLEAQWCLVRPTSIWGPWFEVPYRVFFNSIRKGAYVHPAGRLVQKSFGYVGNTVYQLDSLLGTTDRVHTETLYLADYPPIDVLGMAESVREAFGAAPIRRVPMPLLRLAASLGDFLKVCGWAEPPLTSFRLDNLVTTMIHDLAPLEAVVGQLPYTLEDGVKATVEWMTKHP